MGMIGNTLAQGLISGANIQDGTVDTPDLKDSAVTAAKIATGTITPNKLSTGAPAWDTNSNVGVGVTLSSWDSTYKAIQVGARSMFYGIGSEANMANNAYYNSGYKYVANSGAGLYTIDANVHKWSIAASGTAGNAISFTQAMTLSAGGLLGLGVTSPAYSIDINNADGNLLVNQTRTIVIDTERNIGGIQGGGYSTGTTKVAAANITLASSGAWSSTSTPSYIAFGTTASGSTTASERARIDSSGKLLVGALSSIGNCIAQFTDAGGQSALFNTSSASGAYVGWFNNGTGNGYIGAAAQLVGSGAAGNFCIRAQDNLVFASGGSFERARIDSGGSFIIGTSATTGLVVRPTGYEIGSTPRLDINGAASTVNNTIMQCYSSGASAYRFYIQWNGQIYATQTTITGISDARLKENIVDLDVGLTAIMALRPRKFDWKEGKGKDIKGDRGFVAQEFELVFPDLIDTWKDPAPEGEEPYKSVRQELIPVLVKAIQEQQAIITSLTERITALEAA